MSNVRVITADWGSSNLKTNGPASIRQYDHQGTVVVMKNPPLLDSYWLLVEGHEEVELDGTSWLISNDYTQDAKQLKFQFCAKSNSKDMEIHSAIYMITVLPSIPHTIEEVTNG